ncbi:MAG: hypothetical protein AAF720_12270 [Pseudomonadota bacterium]
MRFDDRHAYLFGSEADDLFVPPSQPWRDEPSVGLPSDAGLSQTEEWVWGELARHGDVDVSKNPFNEGYISSRFLILILFNDPWRRAFSKPVIKIKNAKFRDVIDFESRVFDGKLELENCIFEKEVVLTGLEMRRSLTLNQCQFQADLLADRLSMGGLFLINGSTFDGVVQMDDLDIATDLIASGATFNDLWSLDDAKVDGSIVFGPGSVYRGRIQARRLDVRKSLDLSGSSYEREVLLVGSTIQEELLLDSRIKLQKNMFGKAIGKMPPNFIPKETPVWRTDRAKINVRNVETQILQSSIDAWRHESGSFVPRDLTGFRFSRLGGGENRVESLHREDKEVLVDWLEKDLLRTDRALPNNGYSPARYRALAKTLRETGHESKARYIMWALGRARKRALPRFSFSKIIETLSGQITGYGYQQIRGLFYSVVLITAFAVIGMFWPSSATEMSRDVYSLQDWISWLGFSFEKAVPFSDLDPIEDTFLNDVFGPVLPQGMRAAFMLERVLGIIIIGFVIAGFTGWAERRGE